jgi:hypothetical protein
MKLLVMSPKEILRIWPGARLYIVRCRNPERVLYLSESAIMKLEPIRKYMLLGVIE